MGSATATAAAGVPRIRGRVKDKEEGIKEAKEIPEVNAEDERSLRA